MYLYLNKEGLFIKKKKEKNKQNQNFFIFTVVCLSHIR